LFIEVKTAFGLKHEDLAVYDSAPGYSADEIFTKHGSRCHLSGFLLPSSFQPNFSITSSGNITFRNVWFYKPKHLIPVLFSTSLRALPNTF